jgi:hypothetical protein
MGLFHEPQSESENPNGIRFGTSVDSSLDLLPAHAEIVAVANR